MVFVETLLTLATEKVGETLIEGIGATLNPQAIEVFLKDAIATANKTHPQLLSPFPKDGLNGYGRFLNGFFKGRALAEISHY